MVVAVSTEREGTRCDTFPRVGGGEYRRLKEGACEKRALLHSVVLAKACSCAGALVLDVLLTEQIRGVNTRDLCEMDDGAKS